MTGPDTEFSAQDVLGLFQELSDYLQVRHESAHLFVVGGAAMAMEYDAARLTRDVDAAFAPTSVVRAAARVIGGRHDLEPDWLNDGAKGFMPGDDEGRRTVFESASLLVQVPSPEYLLAMKLHAGREDRDLDDATTLARVAGLSAEEELLNVLERHYSQRQLEPRHWYHVQEVVRRVSELTVIQRPAHRVAARAYPQSVDSRSVPDDSRRRTNPASESPFPERDGGSCER